MDETLSEAHILAAIGRGTPAAPEIPMAKKAKTKDCESGPPDIARWQTLAAAELKGKPLTSLDWQTPEGMTVKPLYTEADLEDIEAQGCPWGEPLRGGRADCRGRRAGSSPTAPRRMRRAPGSSA